MANTLKGASVASTYDQLFYRNSTEPSTGTTTTQLRTGNNAGDDDIQTALYLGTQRIGIGTSSPSEALDVTGNINSSGTGVFGGTLTCATSLTIGSAVMAEADLEKLDDITNGTAAANKAVVLDASKNIATIGTISCGIITQSGTTLANTYSPKAGGSDIVTTGALNSGSITSGFGNIDNGTSTITSGGDMNIDSGTLFVDVSENKVGIGTDTPNELLQVKGATPKISCEATSGDPYFRLVDNGGIEWDMKLANSTNYFHIDYEQSTKLTIKDDGNVGIGTSDPQKTLHVSSSIGAQVMFSREHNTIVADNELGRLCFGGDDPTDGSYQQGAFIKATADGEWGSGDTPDETDCPTRLEFATVADGTSSLNIAMTIDSTGSVGIGTTSPSSLLHIQADSTATTAPTEVLRLEVIDADTDLGVGEGPAIDFYVAEYDNISEWGARIACVRQNATDSQADASLAFWTGANDASPTEKMRITKDGDVGIGTDDPDQILHIESTGSTTFQIETTGEVDRAWKLFASGTDGNLYVRDETGTNTMMTFDVDGSIGIGTTTPTCELDIAGIIAYKAMRPNYQSNGDANTNWFKIFEYTFPASGNPNQFYHLSFMQNGSSDGNFTYAELLLHTKQQGSSQGYSVYCLQNYGNNSLGSDSANVMEFSCHFDEDPSGGTTNTPKITIYVKRHNVYNTIYMGVMNANVGVTGALVNFDDTSSETEPTLASGVGHRETIDAASELVRQNHTKS